MRSVEEVEYAFAAMCYQCDVLLGEPAGCRNFLNEFDDSLREQFFPQLLEEVELAIQNKFGVEADCCTIVQL